MKTKQELITSLDGNSDFHQVLIEVLCDIRDISKEDMELRRRALTGDIEEFDPTEALGHFSELLGEVPRGILPNRERLIQMIEGIYDSIKTNYFLGALLHSINNSIHPGCFITDDEMKEIIEDVESRLGKLTITPPGPTNYSGPTRRSGG